MKNKVALVVVAFVVLMLVVCILERPVLAKTEEKGTQISDLIPLVADAEILDVRQNSSNTVLEVYYVSRSHIDTVAEFYGNALKKFENLTIRKIQFGYMITANLDKLHYMIMLSENAMDPNPKYADTLAVSVILTGLDAKSAEQKVSEENGEKWPPAELPGVPELMGQIQQILREDGIVQICMIVEGAEMVKKYLDELQIAGFRFDSEPVFHGDHLEFVAFRDGSILNFVYKGIEQSVFFEYLK